MKINGVSENLSADQLPLSGLRVVECVTGPSAAIGRLLAELGADVIKVEPADGAPDRYEGELVKGIGLDFLIGNLSKRSVTLDLATDDGLEKFEALLKTTDILIQNFHEDKELPSSLAAKVILERHPTLIVLSASAFGVSSPCADWQATDPVLQALSGELSISGAPGREPLLPPGNLAYDNAMPQAVYAILVAYMDRLKTGRGDHLDFSILDGATQSLDPGYGIAGSAAQGIPLSKLPRGRPDAGFRYPILPCRDGFVRLCILAPRQWQGMFKWMGRPEEFSDQSFNDIRVRFKSQTLLPAITKLFADKTRAQLISECQEQGVPIAEILSLEEAIRSEQTVARSALANVELSSGEQITLPNGVLEIDGQRAGIKSALPESGEHTEEVLSNLKNHEQVIKATNKAEHDYPLKGLRVLDLGVIVVGAEQGRLLGDYGAEVIKIESFAFPDGGRQSLDGSPMNASVAAGHRNKRSLGLNLREEKGIELFSKLLEQSDVLLTNFKPGTLEKLGFGPDTLLKINPRLIAVDSSAFGPTGPWAQRLGYGPLVRASTGMTNAWRYEDDERNFYDAMTVYPDHVAARIGVIGVLSLLIRRMRTGKGGRVSISQAEVMLSHMAPEIARLSITNADQRTKQDAPWGVFPCEGDDEWCVVTVRNNNDWKAFCSVMEFSSLSEDADLDDAAGRVQQQERIEEAVKDWLADKDPQAAMEQLQQAGVPAAAMLRVTELPTFKHFEQRGMYKMTEHPMLPEAFYQELGPVCAQHMQEPLLGHAPMAGQQTIDIMEDRLDLSKSEIEELIEAQVLEVASFRE